jgi:fluoroacetyl-CoA thioesterase
MQYHQGNLLDAGQVAEARQFVLIVSPVSRILPSATVPPALTFYYPRNLTLISEEHMKESLKPGIKYQHKFRVPPSKTVPALYPESEEFVAMPEVFATGFLVGFLEWACIKAINPHLDWPKEQTVGTHIDVSHEAATPPGLEVTASVELIAVEGKKLIFSVEAHDGVDLISKGRHERFVINKEKFDARVKAKVGA